MNKITRSDNTKRYLLALSRRLSGRTDCRRVEYIVRINDSCILMNPNILVRINRSKDVTLPACWYIFLKLFGASNGMVASLLTTGKYKYCLSADGKKRRWEKIE